MQGTSLRHTRTPTALTTAGLIIDRIERLARLIRSDYEGTTVHLLCVLKGGSAFFQDIVEVFRAIHRLTTQVRSPPTRCTACSRRLPLLRPPLTRILRPHPQSYIPFTFDFIRVKSYSGTQSTGNVQITGIDLGTLVGKHCLLVEDIIDSGKTMSVLVPHIEQNAGVASVKVASLLEKRTPKSVGFKARRRVLSPCCIAAHTRTRFAVAAPRETDLRPPLPWFLGRSRISGQADYCGFTIPDKFIVGYW